MAKGTEQGITLHVGHIGSMRTKKGYLGFYHSLEQLGDGVYRFHKHLSPERYSNADSARAWAEACSALERNLKNLNKQPEHVYA